MRKTMAKTLKHVALGGALAAIATTGFAANQGTVGYTSTGDLTITLDVTDEMRISNLADINFPAFAGADQTLSSPACVYRNGSALQDYEVTATGSGGGGAFVITSGGGATIPYSVEYWDTNVTAPVTSGTPLAATGTVLDNDDCATNGSNNGRIDVTITAANANVAPAGAYVGVLTLTVSPL